MAIGEERKNKEDEEFDKVFYTDTFEQDSGYQEVLCPMLRGGCSQDDFKTFKQKWSIYAGCCDELDDRELRQELLNCAVGPLEDRMYNTLGTKVDTLSETDLMKELEKLALVKTSTEMLAVDHHPRLIMKNPVQQQTLTMGNSVYMSINPSTTELYYEYPVRISKENPTQQPSAHRSPSHSITSQP